MMIRSLTAQVQQHAREIASLESKLADHVESEVLVKLKPGLGIETAQELAALYGADRVEVFDVPPQMRQAFGGDLVLMHTPELTTAEAIAVVEKNPAVEYAEANLIVEAAEREPDDLHRSLYGLRLIGAPTAWDATVGSRTGPVIAVLDSGIDLDHPDLVDNLWTNPDETADGKDNDRNRIVDDLHGYNTVDGSGNPDDDNSHGTHVAGTIGAVGNNGQGVVGVNWEARIMGVKFLKADGKGSVSNAVKGVLYASAKDARIVNHSWTYEANSGSRSLRDALRASPSLHLAAAGNDGVNLDEKPHWPASYDLPNLVSVAATDRRDQLAGFSNYSAERVHLAAPGVSTYSTTPGGRYGTKSGTSMATPHVAGVAALVATRHPDLTPAQLKTRLLDSVDTVEGLEGKVSTSGRLNAARAVEDDTIAPAQVTEFRARAVDAGRVELSWSPSGDDGSEGVASGYELAWAGDEVSSLPGSLSGGGCLLMPEAEARELAFTLTARDNAGNRSEPTAVKVTVPGATLVSDGSDWSGDWSPTPAGWSDSPEGNYAHDSSSVLRSPALDLSGVSGAAITFDAAYRLEKDADQVALEARSDGGEWQTLQQFTGERGWDRYRVDLSAFDGQTVHLRFRLSSDASVALEGFELGRLAVHAESEQRRPAP